MKFNQHDLLYTEEKVFSKEQWKREAAAVLEDIKPHVRNACLALLEGTDEHVYINITTIEGLDFCVRLCKNGFSISDTNHDSARGEISEFFETPYALLDKVSPNYRQSFASHLISRLNALSDGSSQINQ